MPLIYPADNESAGDVAGLLLEIAERLEVNPHSIKTNTDNGLGFDVPDEIADEYVKAHPSDDAESTEDSEGQPKRGRPRKSAQ